MKAIVILLSLMLAAPAHAATACILTASPAGTTVSAPKKEMRTVTFKSSMHCQNCVKKITDNVSFAKGVKDLKIDLKENTITVTYDTSKTDQETLAGIIKKLGYTAVCEQPEQ